jgi:hypothetical protein
MTAEKKSMFIGEAGQNLMLTLTRCFSSWASDRRPGKRIQKELGLTKSQSAWAGNKHFSSSRGSAPVAMTIWNPEAWCTLRVAGNPPATLVWRLKSTRCRRYAQLVSSNAVSKDRSLLSAMAFLQ